MKVIDGVMNRYGSMEVIIMQKMKDLAQCLRKAKNIFSVSCLDQKCVIQKLKHLTQCLRKTSHTLWFLLRPNIDQLTLLTATLRKSIISVSHSILYQIRIY